MVNRDPALSDLTKEELITLLNERVFRIDPDDIAFIIWKRKVTQAQAEMNEANEKVQTLTGTLHLAEWMTANREWDEAYRKLEAANAEWEKWR